MSVISTRHLIEVFTSGKSVAQNGQRLAVASYKLTEAMKAKGQKEKKVSVCASIPKVSPDALTPEVMVGFKPYLIQMVEDAQDSILRARNDAEQKDIGDEDISMNAVLAHLEEESKGARLTKEVIAEWFNTSIADMLTVAFADKLGVGDTPSEAQTKAVEQQINVYREKFASLAGGKTKFEAKVAEKLLKALEVAGADDMLAARFQKRLGEMKDTPVADMLGL